MSSNHDSLWLLNNDVFYLVLFIYYLSMVGLSLFTTYGSMVGLPLHHDPTIDFRFQQLLLRAEQLPGSDWQAMANSCWASARLQEGRLVERMAQQLRVEPSFEGVKLQEIANIF